MPPRIAMRIVRATGSPQVPAARRCGIPPRVACQRAIRRPSRPALAANGRDADFGGRNAARVSDLPHRSPSHTRGIAPCPDGETAGPLSKAGRATGHSVHPPHSRGAVSLGRWAYGGLKQRRPFAGETVAAARQNPCRRAASRGVSPAGTVPSAPRPDARASHAPRRGRRPAWCSRECGPSGRRCAATGCRRRPARPRSCS